jgi:hypothetical protein
MIDTLSTTAESQFQPRSETIPSAPIPVSEILKDAQVRFAQSKLLLLRARPSVRGLVAQSTLTRLTEGCDVAIEAIARLAGGGGGEL